MRSEAIREVVICMHYDMLYKPERVERTMR